jgi:hypothetical protein
MARPDLEYVRLPEPSIVPEPRADQVSRTALAEAEYGTQAPG